MLLVPGPVLADSQLRHRTSEKLAPTARPERAASSGGQLRDLSPQAACPSCLPRGMCGGTARTPRPSLVAILCSWSAPGLFSETPRWVLNLRLGEPRSAKRAPFSLQASCSVFRVSQSHLHGHRPLPPSGQEGLKAGCRVPHDGQPTAGPSWR